MGRRKYRSLFIKEKKGKSRRKSNFVVDLLDLLAKVLRKSSILIDPVRKLTNLSLF